MQPANSEELIQLYREIFPEAAHLIKRLGGDLQESKDAFHDALLIYMEREAKGTLNIKTSPKAYLLGTTKILWLHGKKQYFRPLPEDVEAFVQEENETSIEEKNVLDYVLLAGQKCLQMLRAFYYDNLPLQQIAVRFGYNGVRSATVQKYKCIEKIRTELKKRKFHEERFN
jgi:DNA-directed RNA polymerase specialized sigma24 family protein